MKSPVAMTPAEKRVGIWVRVSTEDQVKGESPEHHERRARLYAEAKAWNVREVYRLDGVSGKAVTEHPETQRMLTDIRRGHISGLIFSKLARLARNTRELLDFADMFRVHDADLISLHESIDTSTPAGRLFYTMIAAMAQWEREEIAERVAASIPIRAKLGKSLGGAAPFGYRWDGGKLVPHAVEAPIRRRMYELYVEHKRLMVVARLLNEAGYRTRRGSPFNHTTLAWMVADPTAKGVRRANYTRERSGTKGWELKPETDWVVTDVEPIVPTALWDEANALLQAGKDTGRRRGRPATETFAGHVFCTCGTKMYPRTERDKYICRKCPNKITVDDLEGIFHEQLKGFLLSPEDIARHLHEASDALSAKDQVLTALDAESRRVAQDMAKTHRLYLADQLSVEGFGAIYRPLEERKKQLDDEIPKLQAELDVLKIQILSKDDILTRARDLYGRWLELSREERRTIVEAIVDRIEVGSGDVQISLAYAPLPLKSITKGENLPPSGGSPRCARRASRPHPAGRSAAERSRC